MRTPSPPYCGLDLAPPLADRFVLGVASSTTARYFSAYPSDPASRRAPCPPKLIERWLQVRLGCLRLSPSCPFRLLHTFLSLRPARHYPRLLDTALLIRAPEGLQPSRSGRCPAHTMTESDFSCPFIIGYGSSPSRCGPSYSAPTRHRRPDPRPPRFRCDPFARDVAFDPGRASAPRLTVPHMLPSSE